VRITFDAHADRPVKETSLRVVRAAVVAMWEHPELFAAERRNGKWI
jgi:hypothetical protein